MKTKRNTRRKTLYTPHEIDQTMRMLDTIGATNHTDRELMESAREHGLVEVRGVVRLGLLLDNAEEIFRRA